MYRLYAAISIIIGMYLDSVLFAKVNIAGVVPDCVLVVIVCMGIQLGATEAAAAGCAAGLVIDILFGKAVGIKELFIDLGLPTGSSPAQADFLLHRKNGIYIIKGIF